jgi:DNA repair exonuclease SbcCD ATPase subunit
MIIERLTIANLKGLTKTVEFGEVTVISGPNGSGKSALLDGAILSLLGYIPRIGKKPNLTWALATLGCSMMSVATNRRSLSWTRNPKGAVSVEGLDGLDDVPPVMLDIHEWLVLTGPQRIQYVIEHSGQQIGDATEKVDRLIDQIPRVKEQAGKLDRKDTAKFLKELGGIAKTNRQIAAAELDTIQGVINKTLLTAPAAPPENPEKQAKELQKEIDRKQAENTTYLTRKQDFEEQLAEEQVLLERLQKAAPVVDKAEYAAEIATLTAKVSELEAEAAKFNDGLAANSAKLSAMKVAFNDANGSFEKATALGECPCCGAQIGPVKLGELDAKVQELASEVALLEELLSSRQNEIQEIESERKESKAKLLQLSAKQRTQEAQKQSATMSDEKIKTSNLRIAQLTEDLAKLPVVNHDLASYLAQRDALSVKLKEYAAYKGVERERSKAVEENAVKHDAVEKAKELIAAIKEAEEGLLKQVVGGLLERANMLVGPVLGRSLGFTDGEFILDKAKLETLSGSEETVVFAGLQLALTHLMPERVLILDELRRLDADRFERLLEMAASLIQRKVISQFIGVVPGPAPKSRVEFTSIEMGGAK